MGIHAADFSGGRADFRQVYTAGYMARSGYAHQLYDSDAQLYFQHLLVGPRDIALPFNHLAYESWFYAPFSLLSYRHAYFAFLALNLALLAISFRFLRSRMNALAEVGWWLPMAMFASFLPIAAALLQGQDSIVLLTLVVAAWVSLERKCDLTAGFLIGLGLFKFQVTIPIVLLFFVAWQKWRFSAGFFLSAVAVAAFSAWMVGLRGLEVYAKALSSIGIHLSSAADQFRYGISPAAMPNIRGIIFGLSIGRLSTTSLQVIAIAVSVLVLLLAAVKTDAHRPASALLLVAIPASVLASYHLLIHDLSILFPTVTITLNRYLPAEANGNRKERLLVRAAALMFAAPMLFSYAPGHLSCGIAYGGIAVCSYSARIQRRRIRAHSRKHAGLTSPSLTSDTLDFATRN